MIINNIKVKNILIMVCLFQISILKLTPDEVSQAEIACFKFSNLIYTDDINNFFLTFKKKNLIPNLKQAENSYCIKVKECISVLEYLNQENDIVAKYKYSFLNFFLEVSRNNLLNKKKKNQIEESEETRIECLLKTLQKKINTEPEKEFKIRSSDEFERIKTSLELNEKIEKLNNLIIFLDTLKKKIHKIKNREGLEEVKSFLNRILLAQELENNDNPINFYKPQNRMIKDEIEVLKILCDIKIIIIKEAKDIKEIENQNEGSWIVNFVMKVLNWFYQKSHQSEEKKLDIDIIWEYLSNYFGSIEIPAIAKEDYSKIKEFFNNNNENNKEYLGLLFADTIII